MPAGTSVSQGSGEQPLPLPPEPWMPGLCSCRGRAQSEGAQCSPRAAICGKAAPEKLSLPIKVSVTSRRRQQAMPGRLAGLLSSGFKERGAPCPARARCAVLREGTHGPHLSLAGAVPCSVLQPGARCRSLQSAASPKPTERPALPSPAPSPHERLVGPCSHLHALHPRPPSALKPLRVSPTTPVPAQALAPKSSRGSGTYVLFCVSSIL